MQDKHVTPTINASVFRLHKCLARVFNSSNNLVSMKNSIITDTIETDPSRDYGNDCEMNVSDHDRDRGNDRARDLRNINKPDTLHVYTDIFRRNTHYLLALK